VRDVLIVGGGIAGLSAAWELSRRGHAPMVLERAARPGGVIRTEHVDGFVIDAGPDSLLVQKPAALDLCRELGLSDRLFPTLAPRTAFILRGGRLVPLPEGSVLGIPTKVSPFITTRLFSWRGKARMALELAVRPRHDQEDESIGHFMRRRFGQEAVTYLAEPLLAGIHGGDVNRLSMRAAFPRLVDAERTYGSVLRGLSAVNAGSPSSSTGAFMSLPGGIEELVTTLVDRLPAGSVRTKAEVVAVRGQGPFAVTLGSGEVIDTRAVIVAAPAWAAAPMLASIDAALTQRIAEIPYASSATVVMALRREQVRHPLAGSGYVVPRPERHVLMAASWVSSKWPQRAPAGYVLLRAFVGGAYDLSILDQSDDAITGAVLDELRGQLGITGEPALVRVYRWPRANAQHEIGHLQRMTEIDQRLASYPGLFVTGSGFRGTGIPDCVADGRATAARASDFLG
jgi:protoporphyrinogen/coproporphyrinogen III oxidase